MDIARLHGSSHDVSISGRQNLRRLDSPFAVFSVEDLLLLSGPLDRGYLTRWAARLGIPDRLERALREMDEES